MIMTTKKTNNWGFFIAALYGGFVLFILACVGFASFQRFDLVEKQYYEKGIAHQDQIDQMNRVASLSAAPTFKYVSSPASLVISFPSSINGADVTGQVLLFRPSNSSYDRTVPLAVAGDGTQSVDMNNLPAGKWKVKMTWAYQGQSYYQEELIIAE